MSVSKQPASAAIRRLPPTVGRGPPAMTNAARVTAGGGGADAAAVVGAVEAAAKALIDRCRAGLVRMTRLKSAGRAAARNMLPLTNRARPVRQLSGVASRVSLISKSLVASGLSHLATVIATRKTPHDGGGGDAAVVGVVAAARVRSAADRRQPVMKPSSPVTGPMPVRVDRVRITMKNHCPPATEFVLPPDLPSPVVRLLKARKLVKDHVRVKDRPVDGVGAAAGARPQPPRAVVARPQLPKGVLRRRQPADLVDQAGPAAPPLAAASGAVDEAAAKPAGLPRPSIGDAAMNSRQ